MTETDVGICIEAPLGPDVGPGRSRTGLRNTAAVELIVKRELELREIDRGHEALFSTKV
jgi:hypothetical protein